MKFTPKDGILFGVLCIAFGIYSMAGRGGMIFSSEGWGDIAAILVGLLVCGGSIIIPIMKKQSSSPADRRKK